MPKTTSNSMSEAAKPLWNHNIGLDHASTVLGRCSLCRNRSVHFVVKAGTVWERWARFGVRIKSSLKTVVTPLSSKTKGEFSPSLHFRQKPAILRVLQIEF